MNMTTTTQKSGLAFLVAAAVAMPTLAAAQSGSEEDASIEEVIVTARKQQESLQDIPGSISSLNSGLIEDLQLETVDDMARLIPGFSFSKAFGRATERPVVRGLSNVLAGVQFGVEAGAAYFVDGIYYPGTAQSLDPFTLERIEVVRGPQSALYGRNTYSGAINFVTKDVSDTLGAYVRVSTGDHGMNNLNAGVDIPIGEKAGVRLTFRDYGYDGEWTNLVTNQTVGDESSTGFSATFNYRGDTSSLKARLQSESDEDGTRPFFLQPSSENNCYPAAEGNAAGSRGSELTPGTFLYYCGAIADRPIALNDGPYSGTSAELVELAGELGYPSSFRFFPGYHVTTGVAFSGVERDQTLISLHYEKELANDMLLAVSFADRSEELKTGSDSDHSPVNGTFTAQAPGPDAGQSTIGVGDDDRYSDFSLEALVRSGPEANWRWSAGLYIYDQSVDEYNINFPGHSSNGRKTDSNTLSNTSIFGSLSRDLSDQLTLDIEARFQMEEKTNQSFDAEGAVSLDQNGSWDDFLPRVSLTYKADEATTWYGIFAQGTKPGGFNGTSGVDAGIPEYEQESNTTIEGGWKKIWSNRLRTNIAVYNSTITEVQGTEPVPNAEGARTSIVKNSGDGEVFGFEIELNYILNDNWDLFATYTLAASEYTSGCDETQFQLTSGGGNYFNYINLTADSTEAQRTAANPNGQGNCSIAGNQFAFSPENSYSAVVSFHYPLGSSSWTLTGGLDMSFEDKKYAQVHNGAYTDAVTLFGLRIGARNDRYSIMFTGRNITDETSPILVTRWLSPVFGSTPRWFFANPRPGANFGLEFNAKF